MFASSEVRDAAEEHDHGGCAGSAETVWKLQKGLRQGRFVDSGHDRDVVNVEAAIDEGSPAPLQTSRWTVAHAHGLSPKSVLSAILKG